MSEQAFSLFTAWAPAYRDLSRQPPTCYNSQQAAGKQLKKLLLA